MACISTYNVQTDFGVAGISCGPIKNIITFPIHPI